MLASNHGALATLDSVEDASQEREARFDLFATDASGRFMEIYLGH
jgi:hypothetical protein